MRVTFQGTSSLVGWHRHARSVFRSSIPSIASRLSNARFPVRQPAPAPEGGGFEFSGRTGGAPRRFGVRARLRAKLAAPQALPAALHTPPPSPSPGFLPPARCSRPSLLPPRRDAVYYPLDGVSSRDAPPKVWSAVSRRSPIEKSVALLRWRRRGSRSSIVAAAVTLNSEPSRRRAGRVCAGLQSTRQAPPSRSVEAIVT